MIHQSKTFIYCIAVIELLINKFTNHWMASCKSHGKNSTPILRSWSQGRFGRALRPTHALGSSAAPNGRKPRGAMVNLGGFGWIWWVFMSLWCKTLGFQKKDRWKSHVTKACLSDWWFLICCYVHPRVMIRDLKIYHVLPTRKKHSRGTSRRGTSQISGSGSRHLERIAWGPRDQNRGGSRLQSW